MYIPGTDFVALLRTTNNGVRTERMPGLDFVIAAMARAGMFMTWVSSSPPQVNFATTAWVKPAPGGSATGEASVYLYNTATAQYEIATPALWTALLLSGSPSQAQAVLGQRSIIVSKTVNFNSGNSDTVFPLLLPVGFVRFQVSSVKISGASGSLTTATAGLFTGIAGAGVAIVTGASALTVNTAADATNNNAQAMTVNNANTETYLVASVPNLYFRVANPQGVPATANVTLAIDPVL